MEDAVNDYAAGFAAGVATVLVGHPFDTVKVKLQTQNTEVNTIRYRSTGHCILNILKSEGLKGFYKGATSSFVGVAVESSLLFGAYSQMRTALQGKDSSEPKLSAIVPSAAVGGACISMILCPSELVKCRLQVQASEKGNMPISARYTGPLDCLQKTVKNDGIQGLFKGGVTTLMRESIGNSTFFITYEFTRHWLLSTIKKLEDNGYSKNENLKKTLSQSTYSKIAVEGAVDVLSGGFAGMTFWSVILPLDVAKTRIQTAVNPKSSRNPFHNLRLIYRDLGYRGLYAGLGPTLTRAFPANAAAMMTWELTAWFLGVPRHSH